jgi:hypothetical protein
MSAAELAQFRFQQIRAIENQQVLEKANVELRKEIENLRNNNKSKETRDKLVLLARTAKIWLAKMKLELEQTKGFCTLQSNQILFLNETIKETVQSMAGDANSKHGDIAKLKADNAAISKELIECQKLLKESQKTNALLQDKQRKLLLDCEEREREKTNLIQYCDSLKLDIGQCETKFGELNFRYEVSIL